jgi:hypothetical protein
MAKVFYASDDKSWVAAAPLTIIDMAEIAPDGTIVIVHGSLSTKTLHVDASM